MRLILLTLAYTNDSAVQSDATSCTPRCNLLHSAMHPIAQVGAISRTAAATHLLRH